MKTVWTSEPDWPGRAEALARSGDSFEVRGFQYVQHIGTYAYLAVKYRLRARYDRLHQLATFQPAVTAGAARVEMPVFQ